MNYGVLAQIVYRPKAQISQNYLFLVHIERIVLAREFVGLQVASLLAGLVHVVRVAAIIHFGVLPFFVGVLLRGGEEAPTAVEIAINMELLLATVFLDRGPVDSDAISNFAHDRAVLEPLRINNNCDELYVARGFAAQRMQRCIDHLERGDKLIG